MDRVAGNIKGHRPVDSMQPIFLNLTLLWFALATGGVAAWLARKYAQRQAVLHPVGEYWLVRYREVNGTILETTIRVISVNPKTRRIAAWCHTAVPGHGHGHERELDVDRFVCATDIFSGASIDAANWLVARAQPANTVRW